MVKDNKYVVTCHRINDKICIRVWDLQLALLSHSTTDYGEQEDDGIANPLFQKEFEEPDPHPLRAWTINADEFQIILSSEVMDASNEPRAKFIIALKFV